jgi:hypothetical protein
MKRRIKVYVDWSEWHDGDWRQMMLRVLVEYRCPIDRFWDDDLVEMLESGDLLNALGWADYQAHGYDAGVSTAKECEKFYEAEITTILDWMRKPERWTLTRKFESPDFIWTIQYTERNTDIGA